MADSPPTRTGIGAIAAGTFYFLGQGGELVFDEPESPFIVLGALGFAAVAVAARGLRPLVSGRSGQWGGG